MNQSIYLFQAELFTMRSIRPHSEEGSALPPGDARQNEPATRASGSVS